MNEALWSTWIGRSERAEDVIEANRANALRATLESEDRPFMDGDPLPELWHWCYFWALTPQAALGSDGHAARGEFLPPIDLPRRMWAGSRITWHRPLLVGEPAARISTIMDITRKEGRSGPLAFVTVRHAIAGPDGPAVEEEHDIVYRAGVASDAPSREREAPPAEAPWRREIDPDPVLLFRYSALTFNGHRIHYDQPYVTGVEGYPGLIVHGPLLATLMVDLARREAPGRHITGFSFKALSPIFATAPFSVCGAPDGEAGGAEGTGAALWVVDAAGGLAMQGAVSFAEGVA